MVSRFAGKLSFLDGLFKQGSSNRVARSFVHFAESPGNWLLELADRLNLDPHLAAFLDRRANQKEAELENFPAIPGILPMLTALRGRFPLAIVSARNEVTTHHSSPQPTRTSSVVVTSQTCRATNHCRSPALRRESAYHPIENCLMIGDTV